MKDLDAAALATVVARLVEQLAAEVERGRVSPATGTTYARAARRFLAYADSPLGVVHAHRPLAAWVADYLEALSEGLVTAAKGELPIARAALNRLLAMEVGENRSRSSEMR